MAPKRGRKSEEKTSDATDSQTTHRRSGRISALNAGKPPAAPAIKPPAKKAKKAEEKKPPSKKAEVKVKTEGKEKAVAEEAPEESEEAPEEAEEALEEAEGESEEKEEDSGRTIVIEHCKQCRCFSKAAGQVQAGLEAGIPGINVVINPEKPRRGCFEVREEGGEPFISLQDLKRPFQKLKALDMDDVTSDILKKFQ